MLPPIIQLVGPTASGKSGLAVDLALALARLGQPAEVVNADSMLVYRGMDIGTAKPSLEERRAVVHHLIDIMEVTETASVAEFQALARGVLDEVRGRGAVPILVGGSALYSRAITDVFEFPGTDPLVRAHWDHELAERGAQSLHDELATRAPWAAEEILPGNGRRLVRALELLDLGQDLRPTLPTWTYALTGVHTIGLDLDRATMDERINQRVDQMWAEGLVDEVRGLLVRGLADGRTASRAIGYRQVVQFLVGELGEDEARTAVAAATRRFARKQLGWYRRDHRIDWRPAGGIDPEALAREVLGWANGEETLPSVNRSAIVSPMRSVSFVKGHGTLNDFVVIVDRYATVPLSADEVRFLCDRRAGIGADGVLRAVKAKHVPEWEGDPDLWFMDYRNADGSIAEMCGNGTRVFGRHLADQDLVSGREVDIATRAGVRRLTFHSDGSVSTDMGSVRLDPEPVRVHLGGREWAATRVDVGNPHAVVLLDQADDLAALDLTEAPGWAPAEAYPNGTNIEFVKRLGDHHLAMRVHERGSGETPSCGTGVVATVATHARAAGLGDGKYRVDVPGGVLSVELSGDRAVLRGPAVIVASGKTTLPG